MIKRERALEEIDNVDFNKQEMKNLINWIYDSVGKCKECTFYQKASFMDEIMCTYFGEFMEPEDYCSAFKEREDEER